jgi:glutamate synthase domain-containing protein 2
MSKEALQYWRRFEKERRDAQKIAQKLEVERVRREEEIREAKRQQKKLNFLLTQTELFSHFISRKVQPNAVNSVSSNPVNSVNSVTHSSSMSTSVGSVSTTTATTIAAAATITTNPGEVSSLPPTLPSIVVPIGSEMSKGVRFMFDFV